MSISLASVVVLIVLVSEACTTTAGVACKDATPVVGGGCTGCVVTAVDGVISCCRRECKTAAKLSNSATRALEGPEVLCGFFFGFFDTFLGTLQRLSSFGSANTFVKNFLRLNESTMLGLANGLLLYCVLLVIIFPVSLKLVLHSS